MVRRMSARNGLHCQPRAKSAIRLAISAGWSSCKKWLSSSRMWMRSGGILRSRAKVKSNHFFRPVRPRFGLILLFLLRLHIARRSVALHVVHNRLDRIAQVGEDLRHAPVGVHHVEMILLRHRLELGEQRGLIPGVVFGN